MFKSVSNKLFKTWITLLVLLGALGFIWNSTVVLHDSYVAFQAFSKYHKDFIIEDFNPKGNSAWNLILIERSLGNTNRETLTEKVDRENQLKALGSIGFNYYHYKGLGSYNVNIRGLWGDTQTSDVEFLWVCFVLWILGPFILILASCGLKRWIEWLLKQD